MKFISQCVAEPLSPLDKDFRAAGLSDTYKHRQLPVQVQAGIRKARVSSILTIVVTTNLVKAIKQLPVNTAFSFIAERKKCAT